MLEIVLEYLPVMIKDKIQQFILLNKELKPEIEEIRLRSSKPLILKIGQDLEKVYQRFPRLKERRNQLAGTLSGGEQQMLAMGRALMSKPTLLLLDEPSMGLSPILVNEIFDIIKSINKDGVTVLLVEQNANKALSIADRAYVLETGNVIVSGKANEVANNPKVREAYLG